MKITMTLDPSSITKAIREVKKYKKDFERKVEKLIKLLVDKGVEIARELVPVDFGDLRESIQGRVEDGKGLIYTDCPYAIYVEFGFGVVGGRDPHPKISVQYDVNHHGEKGWFYFDKKRGVWRWSKGQPSKPFMFHTAQRLEEYVPEAVKEVFG